MSYERFIVIALVMASNMSLTTHARADEGVCREASVPAACSCNDLSGQISELNRKLASLEASRGITADRLRQKKAEQVKELATAVRTQRKSIADFEGFVSWMAGNLAGYNKYIEAGSYAALVGKMLPIPYAGQAAVFTKFIAQFTVSLNESSVSMTRYLSSSQRFLALADALETSAPDPARLADITSLASRELTRDMTDVQSKLSTVSDLSAGALSFLQSLNHYVSSSDEYWNKVKGLVKKVDPKEKSFLSENISNLKAQAERFNGRLTSFKEISGQESSRIVSFQIYDDLAAELTPPATKKP